MEADWSGSDEALIEAYRDGGQPDHLDALILRYIPTVRNMLYQIVLNHADADDLTQEVFVRVANGIGRFNGNARFSTWLYRITMNQAHDFLGRRKRNPAAPSEFAPEPVTGDGHDPGGTVAAIELDDRIQAALQGLNPRLRAAIVLTMIQGISATEAARIESCTLATMYWRIHEARRQLKRQLAEYLT